MRILASAVACLLFVCGLPGTSPAVGTVKFRFDETAFMPIATELQQRYAVETDPRVRRKYSNALGWIGNGSPILEDDLQDVFQVGQTLNRGEPLLLNVEPFTTLYQALVQRLDDDVAAAYDAAGEKIQLFEQANPDVDTSRFHKALTKAAKLLSSARAKPTDLLHAQALIAVVAKLRPISKFGHVPKPSKKCTEHSIVVQKGEYARGPGGLLDFDTFTVEPAFFDANFLTASGHKVLAGGIDGYKMSFGYCDGLNGDYTRLDFFVGTSTGAYPQGGNVGGFQRGKAFEVTMDDTSTVTITEIDTVRNFIRGTYDFHSSTQTGQGTGEFLVFIDP